MGPSKETDIPNPEQLDFYHIKMRVGNKLVSGDLSSDLEVPSDPEELSREISKQPGMFFYWSSVAEVAKAEHEQKKHQFDMWYSEVYSEARQELVEQFGKSGVTETMVKSRIIHNHREKYDEFQGEVNRAAYRKSILSLASKAFLEKGNSMINVLSWRKAQLHESGKG